MGYGGTLKEQRVKRRAYDHGRLQHNARRVGAKRDEDRPGYNAYMREWRKLHVARRLVQEAKGRAKKRGLPFDLCEDDIVVPAICPVLGIPLCSGDLPGPGNNSPTLDRIDPKGGYVKGNVWVISGKANRCKNDATLDELKMLVAALEIKLSGAA